MINISDPAYDMLGYNGMEIGSATQGSSYFLIHKVQQRTFCLIG
jgi:hypothetical protein